MNLCMACVPGDTLFLGRLELRPKSLSLASSFMNTQLVSEGVSAQLICLPAFPGWKPS